MKKNRICDRSRGWLTAGRIALVVLAASVCVAARPPSLRAFCGDGLVEPENGETCDDGNQFGGDGCSFACTRESLRTFETDPEKSFASAQLAVFRVEFPLKGTIGVRTGEPDSKGFLPIAIQESDISLERVTIPGLACVCTFASVKEEFGPGNVAFGGIECGDGGAGSRVPALFSVTQDHNTNDMDPACKRGVREGAGDPHPGACRGPFEITSEGVGGRGTMALRTVLTIRLISDGGVCSVDPSDPAKGPDGIACTADDPTGDDDPAQTIPIDWGAFSGTMRAALVDANNIAGARIGVGETCGAAPCLAEVTGKPFDCDAILSSEHGGADTGEVVFAFPVVDAEGLGDGIVTARLVPKVVPVCTGDCDGDGSVAVNELVRGVNIALGNAELAECLAFDRSGDGVVTVDELIAGVRSALEGCG